MSTTSQKLFLSLVFVLACTGTWLFMGTGSASALSGGSFRAGRIIDDGVFHNKNTMNAGSIQGFLNAKVPSCDTNGSQAHSSGQSRAAYATSRGYPPPYTCLKDYQQNVPARSAESGLCNGMSAGNRTSAQIIQDVSQSCGINPQVLLVLLQKEQSLITDDWPWSIQYRSATGFGCPDTAPCDAEYYGFFNQVYSAARQFKRYARDSHLFNFRPYRSSNIQFSPNASCGSTSVYIENQSTASLYNYTPYQPNASALNNLYGSGDSCGAYGNRNFWRMFNDWFGSVYGIPYAWEFESIAYSGGDNTISTNETDTVTLRVRNTGSNPWYNQGSGPVRLATWGPDRSSLSYSPGWVSPARLDTLNESVVMPGEVGTFTFNIKPQMVGTIVESLNLIVEGYEWMPWNGYAMTVFMRNAFQYGVSSVDYSLGTGLMEPGQSQTVTVKVVNTGSATWSKTTGPPIRLSTWGPGRPSPVAHNWISNIRAAEMQEATVAPGQTATFVFGVYAPSSAYYYERLNIVAEGITWMDDVGLTLYLQGGTYAWRPTSIGSSIGTFHVARNQEFNIVIRGQNLGNVPWRKNSGYIVKMGTSGPFNRGSILEHPSWTNPVRPAILNEPIVHPGGEGTFTLTVRAPSTLGTRRERFSLVAEGYSWFNDPGLEAVITTY